MSRSGLQYLETTQEDVFGNTVDIPSALDRRTEQVFLAGGAIAQGDWVALDFSAADSTRAITVVQAATAATGNPLVVGVAIESATAAGDKIKVVTRGYVEGAAVVGGTAGGTALVVDNSAAGRANAYDAADLAPPCGVTLETAAAGPAHTCDVYVFSNAYTG
jgi:hypothetical protein